MWRAVDQDGDVIDLLVQSRRDRPAAARFFRKLLNGQRSVPRRLVTDKLRSYSSALRTVMPSVVPQHPAVREQSRRGVAPADAAPRTADAAVQVGAGPAISIRSRPHWESLPRGASSASGGASSALEKPRLPHVERHHGDVLTIPRGPTAKGSLRTSVANLTVPACVTWSLGVRLSSRRRRGLSTTAAYPRCEF